MQDVGGDVGASVKDIHGTGTVSVLPFMHIFFRMWILIPYNIRMLISD